MQQGPPIIAVIVGPFFRSFPLIRALCTGKVEQGIWRCARKNEAGCRRSHKLKAKTFCDGEHRTPVIFGLSSILSHGRLRFLARGAAVSLVPMAYTNFTKSEFTRRDISVPPYASVNLR